MAARQQRGKPFMQTLYGGPNAVLVDVFDQMGKEQRRQVRNHRAPTDVELHALIFKLLDETKRLLRVKPKVPKRTLQVL